MLYQYYLLFSGQLTLENPTHAFDVQKIRKCVISMLQQINYSYSPQYVFINQILNYVYNTYVLSATVSPAPFYIIHYRLFSMSNNNHI